MNWTFPIAISPHDHNTVYVGAQNVYSTHDGGHTWKAISPDLTLNDPSMHGDSGGLTIDNLSVEYAGVVFALAESPKEKGQIWAGTNDGQVQVTRDGGAHWTNVTANMPGLFPKMTVNSIEPSRYDAGTCYVALDGHQVNNFDPWLYKTTDYGKTWKLDRRRHPEERVQLHARRCARTRCARGCCTPARRTASTCRSTTGRSGSRCRTTCRTRRSTGSTIQEHFHDLVVGTYGRGYWILDDVTPLEQFTPEVAERARASLRGA